VDADAGDESDQKLLALCVDAGTGAIVWTREVFHQSTEKIGRIHSKNSHASATPLTDGRRLYVHFGAAGTAALTLDGAIVWATQEIRYPPVHGNGGSPVLVDGKLIFNCDGGADPFVVALSAANGKEVWRTPRSVDFYKRFAFSTPLVIDVGGRTQVVSPGAGSVAAYDPARGTELWRVRYEGYSVVPRPVYGHGMVYLSTGYDAPTLMAIRPDGQGDVTETHVVWTSNKGAPHNPSLLLAGTHLFAISDRGVASCYDALTGRVVWSERIGGDFSASPVLAEERIYLQSEDGTGTVLSAAPRFEHLATNPLEERSLASYAVMDGALFIRTEQHLFRIGGARK
jgi:outer membrane protein assembly factor BamB